jgi:hypothetical protein
MYPSPPMQMADHFAGSGMPNCTSSHPPRDDSRIRADNFERPSLPSFTLDSSNQMDATSSVTLDYHSYSQTPSPALTPLLTPSKPFAHHAQQLQLQIPKANLRERSVSQPSPISQADTRTETLSRPKSMTGVSELTSDCRFNPQSLPDYAAEQRQHLYTMTY